MGHLAPYRLWQLQPLVAGRARRPRSARRIGRMARHAADPRRFRRQHRRSVLALDERCLCLEPSSRLEFQHRRPCPHLAAALLQSALRHTHRMPSDLPRSGQSAKIRAGRGGALCSHADRAFLSQRPARRDANDGERAFQDALKEAPMEALKNQWYAAAFSHELKEAPLGRVFLNQPVVLYRKTDGTPVALEDRCCHRRAPLSAGKIEGDNLRCGYHGFLYDAAGAAIWAPGQDRLPPGARVRSYPVVESHGWIWIWPGDPARADASAAPSYDKYDDPHWATYDELIPMKSNYFLVVDNLLDLSHLPFLHAATIGSPEDTNPKLSWERGADWVKGVRVARGLSPSPRNLLEGLDFRFDRTQIMLFEPPSQVTIDILSNEYGKEYGDPTDRMNRR